jgi:hypothetical protein
VSRTFRLVLAAGLLAGVAAPLSAHAGPPQPPVSCHLYWVPVAQTTPNLPPVTIYRPQMDCYG